jgi:hypothetical protein
VQRRPDLVEHAPHEPVLGQDREAHVLEGALLDRLAETTTTTTRRRRIDGLMIKRLLNDKIFRT